jgi:hypothetical protein
VPTSAGAVALRETTTTTTIEDDAEEVALARIVSAFRGSSVRCR